MPTLIMMQRVDLAVKSPTELVLRKTSGNRL